MRSFPVLSRVIVVFLFILNTTFAYGAFDSKAPPQGKISAGRQETLAGAAAAAKSQKRAAPEKKYKDAELLVKFKPAVSDEAKKNLHKKHGSEKIKEFKELRLQHLKLKKGVTVEEAVKLYGAEPEVEYAEPNFEFTVQGQPNDNRFQEQWGLYNTGQTGGKPGADIKALGAWNITTGSSDVVVAILDTGIDYNHEDLAANIWSTPGIDVVNNDSDPMDDNGHGTHVAGTIGALGNNTVGVVGVNWNVKIVACKFLNASGSGYTDAAVQCLQYVKGLKDSGVNVVATNNSWGGGDYSNALYDAINAQKDILFIAAAGNDNVDNDMAPQYPASYALPNVISVQATDKNDQRASFSNYGSRSVHIGAPGDRIMSTLPRNSMNLSGSYGSLSGTSMATPHVTGVAALLKAQNPERASWEIRNLILAGGEEVAALKHTTATGSRLSALGSLTCKDKPVFAILSAPTSFPVPMETQTTLKALSINCSAAAGPVTATTPDGEMILLHDDGIAPDEVAGDGIFTASWTPQPSGGARTIDYLSFSVAGIPVAYTPALRMPRYLREANVNYPYSQFLTVRDSAGPFRWSVTSGELPYGIKLNETGILYGHAVNTGTYTFQMKATDPTGRFSTRNYSLRVTDDVIIEQRAMVYDETPQSLPLNLKVDGAGQAYVSGVAQGTGREDFLTVKYDAAGAMVWNRTYDSGRADWGQTTAVDSQGNVYVAGGYPYLFGASDFTIIKYDSDGNQLWTTTYDRGSDEYPMGIAVDASGNLYVGGFALKDGFYADGLLLKYDPSGNLLWERIDTTTMMNRWLALDLDQAGNVYVTGDHADPDPITGEIFYKYVTQKYAPGGELVWSQTYDYGYSGRAVAVDAEGSAYVAGDWVMLLKYDALGSLLWETTVADDLYGATIVSLALDRNGFLYGAGYTDTQSGYYYILAKLDPTGATLWKKLITGNLEQFPAISVAVDGNNNILASRQYDGVIVTSVYTQPLLVEKLPAAVQGNAYRQELKLHGGAAPYTVSLAGGALPSGLSLDGAGVVSGIPNEAGTFVFTLSVTDALGAVNTVEGLIQVYVPLKVILSGSGSGKASLSTGDSCSGGICEFSYPLGTSLSLGATAYRDSVFDGWGGVCAGTGGCAVTMDGIKSVQLGFTKTSSALGVSFPWGGSGTVNISSGQTCSSDCSQTYNLDSNVTLTATPKDGSVFAGWEGACTGTGPCTVAMDADRVVFAKFVMGGSAFPVIAPASNHTAILKADGTVLTWGWNVSGQLGDGTTNDRSTPAPVPGLSGVIAVSSNSQTLALKNDGTVWGWGLNSGGELGDGTTINRMTPQQVKGLPPIKAVATGMAASAAIAADGSVWMWGFNNSGRLGDGTVTQRLAPVRVEGISGVVAISVGGTFTLALKDDGTIWGWGANYNGQLGVGSSSGYTTPHQVDGISGVVAIANGYDHSVALKSDGTIWTWGGNSYWQLGNNGSQSARNVPTPSLTIKDVVAIAAGVSNTYALKGDGTLLTWGSNYYGQLGLGDSATGIFPAQVALTGVIRIANGGYDGFAQKNDGTVWAWGDNFFGNLGDGSNVNRFSPVQVLSADGIPPVAAFGSALTAGNAPLIVSFNDLSTGSPTSWKWNFGDSSTATEQHPVHVYKNPGTYAVSLTATNRYGSDTRTRSDYITVLACYNQPVRLHGNSPVTFADLSSAYLQAQDDDVIELQALDFSGDLRFDREVRVSLKGGFDCGYDNSPTAAAFSGKITLVGGTVKPDRIRLR